MPTARLIQSPATLYAQPNFNMPLIELPVGREIQLGSVKNSDGLKWVAVALPDGRKGFLPGDTRVFTRKSATLLQDEVVVRALPSASAGEVARYTKNAKFDLIDQVAGEGGDWVQVCDAAGRQGYIDGQTRVRTTPIVTKDVAASQMRTGALWCIGGIAITAITYSAASDGGGYLIMWGPMLWGGWTFLKGLFNYFSEA